MSTASMPPSAAPDRDAIPVLLDVRSVAALLDCSPRHVYRMSDAGKMPGPVRIGALVRWRRQEIDDWLVGGCKPVRSATRIGRKDQFVSVRQCGRGRQPVWNEARLSSTTSNHGQAK